MTPTDLVQRQLDAYNDHDLGQFLACYSDAIRTFRMPAHEPAITGKAELGEFYATHRFNRPQLHAEVLSRIVLGNKVIDHERVHGLGPVASEVVAVYEVEGGLIQNVWFFSPQSST